MFKLISFTMLGMLSSHNQAEFFCLIPGPTTRVLDLHVLPPSSNNIDFFRQTGWRCTKSLSILTLPCCSLLPGHKCCSSLAFPFFHIDGHLLHQLNGDVIRSLLFGICNTITIQHQQTQLDTDNTMTYLYSCRNNFKYTWKAFDSGIK